ncbi:MAG: hypothetical protein RLZZ162_2312 [Verrucomicrobiota bacterium]
MTFATPELLWLLLAPVALLVWELTHRRRTASLTRPKILRAEAGANSLNLKLSPSTTASASRVRFWLFAGTSLAIFALARPQYGRLEEPVFDQSREILLAIDLSRSMLAPDVKPSRLERAKLLIQSLLEKLEGERVGLVVFAGTAFLQSPLSADYEILREFLPALGPDYLPQGGSNYGALLDASLQAFSHTNAADRFLMILSDGEATDDDWKKRIEELKKKNIRVLGLGVGTLGGAMLPDGTGGFVKDERGAVVLSKLETGTLQELAAATGGVYRDASGWLDLAGLAKETVEAGRKGQFLEKNTIRLAERFQWPLALGLWCLLVSFYSEFPVRPRPRDLKLTPHPRTPPPVPTVPRPLTTAVASLALCSLVIGHWALGITPAKPAASAPASPAATPPPASEALAKIIGRVAAAESRTARDWAELGRETVTWGGRLQSEQQPIPEGPVRDALAAVDAGAKLDAKTADWPKLREELAALLKKSEEQKQDQQKQDDKDQQDQKEKQDQKDQDQKNQDQKKSDKQDQSKDSKDPQQEKSDEQKKQDQQPQDKDDKDKQGESAFGDMKKNEPPPPPPPEDPGTQKVGGTPEKKESEQQPADPSLALPLQKLEQLRNQDSPAHLFQIMEGEKKPATKTKGKDW